MANINNLPQLGAFEGQQLSFIAGFDGRPDSFAFAIVEINAFAGDTIIVNGFTGSQLSSKKSGSSITLLSIGDGSVSLWNVIDYTGDWALDGESINRRFVNPKTVDYTIQPDWDGYNLFTNEGAGAGITFTLPTPGIGQQYTFMVTDAQNVTIDAGAGNVILNANVSQQTWQNNVPGSSFRLVCVNATTWIVEAITGTWV